MFVGVSLSVLSFYIALSFGRSGSPGCLAQMAGAIRKLRTANAHRNPQSSGVESFASFPLVDDGVPIAPNLR